MLIAMLASASVMLAAEASTAAAENGAAPEQRKSAERVSDPVICREETIPNSRFTKRVCLHKSDREARANHKQEDFKEIVDRPFFPLEKGN